jgi:hypothetical protein
MPHRPRLADFYSPLDTTPKLHSAASLTKMATPASLYSVDSLVCFVADINEESRLQVFQIVGRSESIHPSHGDYYLSNMSLDSMVWYHRIENIIPSAHSLELTPRGFIFKGTSCRALRTSTAESWRSWNLPGRKGPSL